MTWHATRLPQLEDAETQSNFDFYDDSIDELAKLKYGVAKECPVHNRGKSRTLPAEAGLSPNMPNGQLMMDLESLSHKSHSRDSWVSSISDNPRMSGDGREQSRHHYTEKYIRDQHKLSSQQKPCNVEPNPDVRPKQGANDSFTVSTDCTFSDHDNSRDSMDNAAEQDSQQQAGEGNGALPPPVLLNNAFVSDPIAPSHRMERPKYVSKVFKKYREMKCNSFCSNDIKIEYHGKMPKKSSALGKSRDSGVNCVGLANPHPKNLLYREEDWTHSNDHYSEIPARGAAVDQHNGAVNSLEHTGFKPVPEPQNVHPLVVSQEDSGFNSPHVLSTGIEPPTPKYQPKRHSVFTSTPNNLSPASSSSQNSPEIDPEQTNRDPPTPEFPGRLTNGEFPAPPTAGIPYADSSPDDPGMVSNGLGHAANSGGSRISMWSDSSRQTVREADTHPDFHRSRSSPPPFRNQRTRPESYSGQDKLSHSKQDWYQTTDPEMHNGARSNRPHIQNHKRHKERVHSGSGQNSPRIQRHRKHVTGNSKHPHRESYDSGSHGDLGDAVVPCHQSSGSSSHTGDGMTKYSRDFEVVGVL